METHAKSKDGANAAVLLKTLRAASEKAKREYVGSDRGISAVCECLLKVRAFARARRPSLFLAQCVESRRRVCV